MSGGIDFGGIGNSYINDRERDLMEFFQEKMYGGIPQPHILLENNEIIFKFCFWHHNSDMLDFKKFNMELPLKFKFVKSSSIQKTTNDQAMFYYTVVCSTIKDKLDILIKGQD